MTGPLGSKPLAGQWWRAQAFNPMTREAEQADLCVFEATWLTERVLGQLELHREILS